MITPKKIEFGKRFTITFEEKVSFDDVVMTFTGEGNRIILGGNEKLDRVVRYAEFLLARDGEFDWLRIYEETNEDGVHGESSWDRYKFSIVGRQHEGRAISLIVLKEDKKEMKFRLGHEFSLSQHEVGICKDIKQDTKEIRISFEEGNNSYIILKVSKENIGKEKEEKEIKINLHTMEKWKEHKFYLQSITKTKKGIIARLRIDVEKNKIIYTF